MEESHSFWKPAGLFYLTGGCETNIKTSIGCFGEAGECCSFTKPRGFIIRNLKP